LRSLVQIKSLQLRAFCTHSDFNGKVTHSAIVGEDEDMVVEKQGMGMVFWRLKDGPMGRVFRIVFYGLLFLLLLSVAGREIPEI